MLAAVGEYLSNQRQAGRKPWQDYDVRFALRDDPLDPARILLRDERSFADAEAELLFAVTEDATVADRLCAEYDHLTDVYVPSSGRAASTVLAAAALYGDGWRSLQLTKVSGSDVGISGEHLPMFQASVPLLGVGPKRIRLTAEQAIDRDEGMCYWSAARSLMLREIQVDFSLMASGGLSFKFLPYLGASITPDWDETFRTLSVRVDRWLAPGQGFSFRWRPA